MRQPKIRHDHTRTTRAAVSASHNAEIALRRALITGAFKRLRLRLGSGGCRATDVV
jgi:hypothetical protein